MNPKVEFEKVLRKNGFSDAEIAQYLDTFNGKIPC
jgi:hypothetical protein